MRYRRAGVRIGVCALAAATALAGSACGASAQPRAAKSGVRGEPGAATSAATAAATAAAHDVRTPMRKLEASFHGRVGAYAVDTGTGRAVAYRGYERFPSDSSFKAVLCGAILRKARTRDPGLLGRTLHWTKADVLPNSPVAGKPENVKNGLTTAALCRAAINLSDNTAANVLLRQVGGPPGVTRTYRWLGDPVGRLDRTEPTLNDWHPGERRDTVMPAFMARDLRALTLGRALARADRARLIGWLRATETGTQRIRAGLPKGWTSGDKTGTGGAYATASDIAVAWPPSGAPVVIAVYMNRPVKSAEPDESVIARATSILVRGLGKA